MKTVRPKKKFGQHFLKDPAIAKKIADTLQFDTYEKVLEIGPGKGVLTQFLTDQGAQLFLVEIDPESAAYLQLHFPHLKNAILQDDFLKLDLKSVFQDEPFAIIGNFPYNISSQILFKTLTYRNQIPFLTGMFQKEVAERICEPPGSKKYGILSVWVQLFYKAELLFTVSPQLFYPPPKVDSAVIQLTRKEVFSLPCDETLLFKIVKTSFQQRRKTLRNSLKSFALPKFLTEDAIFDLRPEKLSGSDFVSLTQRISNGKLSSQ